MVDQQPLLTIEEQSNGTYLIYLPVDWHYTADTLEEALGVILGFCGDDLEVSLTLSPRLLKRALRWESVIIQRSMSDGEEARKEYERSRHAPIEDVFTIAGGQIPHILRLPQ